MFATNPKKEFTVNYTVEDVRTAILKIPSNEPGDYKLVKDDAILSEIRIHQKGVLLDMGYHIDFTFNKVGDAETKVIVEVSRNLGSINTAAEVSIANNTLKSFSEKFSSYLSGNVDEKGKAKTSQPSGCMLIVMAGIGLGTIYLIITNTI